MSFPSWILFGLAGFLVADAVLAIVYGRPYMMLGLKYMPAIYRDFITRVSMLPRVTLLDQDWGMYSRARPFSGCNEYEMIPGA